MHMLTNNRSGSYSEEVFNSSKSYRFRVVAKITHRIREMQQPLLYTTGSDQHVLTTFSYSGSLWRTMLLWDTTPHLQFSIFSSNSTIMMAIDRSHSREVAVFDIQHRRRTTNLLCDTLVNWSPNEI